MKKLLDLNISEVVTALHHVPVPTPITVKNALLYLMFMEAISTELIEVGNDPNKLTHEQIVSIAKQHGDMVEHDLSTAEGDGLQMKMLENQMQAVLFTRLVYLVSRLLAD